MLKVPFCDHFVESFYSVKYGSSIITSNVCQIISVMKTRKMVFQKNKISKIVHFGILVHVLSTIIWRNKWCYIIWWSRSTRLFWHIPSLPWISWNSGKWLKETRRPLGYSRQSPCSSFIPAKNQSIIKIL